MVRKKEARRKLILKFSFCLVGILLLIDFLILFFGRSLDFSVFADFMNIIVSFGVVLISFFCYSHLLKKFPEEKKFFLILFVAFIFRFFGELSWAYFDLSLNFIPDFSFADAMWMISYFLIIVGFGYHLKEMEIPKRNNAVLFFTSAIGLISLLFIFAVYLVMLNIMPSAKFAFLINESYVLLDLIILALVLTPLYFSIKKHSKCFYFYFLFALGFVFYTIYDLLFAQMFLQGTYFSGGKVEFLYFLSYFCIFSAFYSRYKYLNDFKKKI
jgi:hypothetical protein